MFNISDINILAELSRLDTALAGGLATAVLLALLLLWLAVSNLRRGRVVRTLFHSVAALVTVSLALVVLLVAINLTTYSRFNREERVAEIHFSEILPRVYETSVYTGTGVDTYQKKLAGDQWQIDARIIRWGNLATLFGLNSHYRLERLSGRYRDIEEERELPRSVHELGSDKGLSIAELTGRYPELFSFVDSYYGNSVYMPMVDAGRFEIVIARSGLLARPLNEAARLAVKEWR